MSRWPEKDWERFEKLENAGWSTAQLAREFRVTVKTIERWRAATGRSQSVSGTRHPATDRDRARALLEDGCSIAETARTVGVAWITIVRWFPDAPRWSRSEASQFALAVRRS